MIQANDIIEELKYHGNAEKANHLARFFKTGKGQYGEGECFIGVTVPEQRKIAKKYIDTPYGVLEQLIRFPFHEARLTALLIVVYKFGKTKKTEEQKSSIDFYIAHTSYINNWDLVDLTCYKLLGEWLLEKDREILYQWATTDDLWKQRMAIVTCMCFVRKGDFCDCLAISKLLLSHPHDLIHKAVGWLLREVGKKDKQVLTGFLHTHYQSMPRTMLRYAIERFPEEERLSFLKKK